MLLIVEWYLIHVAELHCNVLKCDYCRLTFVLTMAPVRPGLMMPGRVANVLDSPINILAN